MTEEELYNRYHEIQSTYVEVRFIDGESLIGKLDSFVSGVNNEPDEMCIRDRYLYHQRFYVYLLVSFCRTEPRGH